MVRCIVRPTWLCLIRQSALRRSWSARRLVWCAIRPVRCMCHRAIPGAAMIMIAMTGMAATAATVMTGGTTTAITATAGIVEGRRH